MNLSEEKYKKVFLEYSFSLSLLYVCVVYLPVNYLGPINFDDVDVMARIQAGFSNVHWADLFFRNTLTRYYRPLLDVLCYLDYAMWGNALSAWHLTNYILHMLNAVMVYQIACIWFSSEENYKVWAAVTMLLFALNPLTCESVAWISGRSDLAATLFSLIAVRIYYLRSKIRYFVVPACILAGLLCKESALAIIPIIVLLEAFHRYREGGDIAGLFKGCLVWGGVVLISVAVYIFFRTNGLAHQTYVHAKAVAPMVSDKYKFDWAYVKNILNLVPVSAFYIKKLFVPFPLNFAITQINTTIYSLLFLVIIFINVFFLSKKKWALPFFSLIALISFSPALIVAMGGLAWVSMAERYLYLSLSVMAVGTINFLLYCYDRQAINTNFLIAILVVILLTWSTSTFLRQFDFKNSKSIWTATLKRNPDDQNVLFMYGTAVEGPEGEAAFHKALENPKPFPLRDKTHFNIALYESRNGNYEEAVFHIEKALALKSSYNSHIWAASILLDFGHLGGNEKDKKYIYKAVEYLKKARAKRESVFVLNKMATQLAYIGDLDQANKIYREILEKYPDSQFALYAKKHLEK